MFCGCHMFGKSTMMALIASDQLDDKIFITYGER